jgi:hypothetical protein
MEGEDEKHPQWRGSPGLSSKRTNVVEFTKSKASRNLVHASSIDVNASSGPAYPALNLDELRSKVQRIVMYGTIREAKHSAVDRAYRDISQDDILSMLEGKWVLSTIPDWDDEHRNWEYLLAGTDIEGDPLSLKIAVNEEMQRIDIITKF